MALLSIARWFGLCLVAIPFIHLSINHSVAQTLSFEHLSALPLNGVHNGSIAWGDFNGDGQLDLITTGLYLNGLSIGGAETNLYTNLGDGSFEPSSYSLPNVYNGSVAWGDLNNDGYLDLIITGVYNITYDDFYPDFDGYISKIFIFDGSDFVENETQITGVRHSSVAMADYDNDGFLDFIIAGEDNYNEVSTKLFRNNGDGTFTEQTSVQLPPLYMGEIAWGDFDNDGYVDILLAGATINNSILAIYRNNGDNTFTEIEGFTRYGNTFFSAKWGDYNNDGYLDILLAGEHQQEGTSAIYRNNGDGTFSLNNANLPVVFGKGHWADFNNDGLLDVILSGDILGVGKTQIFINKGNDTFEELESNPFVGVKENSIALGDFNNDGNIDVAIIGLDNENTSVARIYKNLCTTTNSRPNPPTGLGYTVLNQGVKLTWSEVTSDETPKEAMAYNVALTDNTGHAMLIPTHSTTNGIRQVPNLGNAQLGTSHILNYPFRWGKDYYASVQAIDNSYQGGEFSSNLQIVVDPIQASGLLAKNVNNNSIVVKWQRGNGDRSIVFAKEGNSGSALPVDNTTYYSNPIFGEGSPLGESGWYCVYKGKADSALVGGLDPMKDYLVNVITFQGESGEEKYMPNHISHTNIGIFNSLLFTEQTHITTSNFNINTTLAWADFDNDGFLDFLVTGYTNSGYAAELYHNNGENEFKLQNSTGLPGVTQGSIAWADLNNDGYPDVLVTGTINGSSSGAISRVYLNNHNGTFTYLDAGLIGVFKSSVTVGDYNNDGNIDILLSGASDGGKIAKVYRNNGDGTFTDTNAGLPGIESGNATWGDYNNDGYLDILLTGSGIAKIYRNNGNETFTEQTSISLTGVSHSASAWGDFNNDGYLDIVITGGNPYSVAKLYNNNGNGTFSEVTGTGLPGVSSGTVTWTDYNNDGNLDIIITGLSYLSDGTSAHIAKVMKGNGKGNFTEEPGFNLKGIRNGTVSLGDYDNDGDTDVLITGYNNFTTITKVFKNNTIMPGVQQNANVKPESPQNLTSIVLPGTTTLSWSPIKTDETPYKAMSYNVWVGTEVNWQNGITVVPAHSDLETGYRKVVSMGNAQLDTNFILRNLPLGIYYWKVQAVDQGYVGGSWSEVASFEIKNIQAFFHAGMACLNSGTQFTDLSQSIEEVTSWQWDFGDGTTSNESNPAHTYTSAGVFTVTLSVATASFTDSYSMDIVVGLSPIADFTAPTVCLGSTTPLSNLTNQNGLTITEWLWDFGDGVTSNQEDPLPHRYYNAGEFEITLYATAHNGCVGIKQKIVQVGEYPQVPISANGPLTFCQGENVVLEVPQNSSYAYSWLNEGVSITGATSHIYSATQTGSYSVTASNPVGECVSTSGEVNVTVRQNPAKPVISEVNNQIDFCPGTIVTLQVENPWPEYIYQWRRSGVDIPNANGINYSGKLSAGDYSAVAIAETCSTPSDNLTLTTKPTPAKPAIYARGPNVWILGCSNETATAYRWYHNDALIPGATTYTYVANQQLGNYFVRVNEGGECWTATDVINIPTGTIVGIDISLNPTEVAIFPNPSGGLFYVQLGEGLVGRVRVRVTNALGQVVLAQEHSAPAFTLDLSSAPKGVYLCR
ncbi:MAG: FG-GAP-like repeat-containing protein, partial [Tenuifilaceae bacterium]|nr:FG-GAP-like repeat-containing protein [Tenuifilaceae bacterium]